MSSERASFDDYIDETDIERDKFDYLEGSDVIGEGDSYAEGTPLHSVYESRESRVIASFLSEGEAVLNEENIERLSGVSDVGNIADELVEEGVIRDTGEGYQLDTDNPEVHELVRFENQLLEAWHAEEYDEL